MAIEIKSGDILSSEQLKTHLRIFAGPGAGKTHFLVENVKSIVTTLPLVAKSSVRKVLCVTYTNSAVHEIQRRLDYFSNSVEVRTIHSFIFEHIIKLFQKDLREIMFEEFGINIKSKELITPQIEGFGILHGIEKEDIYKFITKSTNGMESLSYSKKDMGDVQINTNEYLNHGSEVGFKISLSRPKSINKDDILPIKEFIWSKVRKLTYNEILYFGYRILERNSTALYTIRVKFPFIFVDEFQDTNPFQTKLIKLIGRKSTIVSVIGDIAQSIYSFQGATPEQFSSLIMDGEVGLIDYAIKGNRRSTSHIVEFCNYIRKTDSNVIQESIRTYASNELKATTESKPIHFLVGNNEVVKQTITKAIEDGGVVLTRTWAAAFNYVRGIDEGQLSLLKEIINNYYNSPINIRAEIAEIGNVTWVRAFNFIFSFHKAYTSGSFIDAYNAFKLYVDLDSHEIDVKILKQIKSLAEETFNGLTETSYTVDIIEKLNSIIGKPEYSVMRDSLFCDNFDITIFDEYDLSHENSKLVNALKQLTWTTSYKLFSEVFSKNSRYMTVHQAKGLEWDKVIVSVEPNNFERKMVSIKDIFINPKIRGETAKEEFVRMYYVACSRAKEDLYIHLPAKFDTKLIDEVFNNNPTAYEIIQ